MKNFGKEVLILKYNLKEFLDSLKQKFEMVRPRTVSKLVYEDKETGCHIIEYADVGHIVSTFTCPGAVTTGVLKISCTEKFTNIPGKYL